MAAAAVRCWQRGRGGDAGSVDVHGGGRGVAGGGGRGPVEELVAAGRGENETRGRYFSI
jgi:hypothetical protein